MKMKFLLLAIFVAAVSAAPAPLDNNEVVEVIVNGVPEGEALELGGIVDINLKEHVNGELSASSDLLHPYTAVGLAEAALAAAEAAAEVAPSPVQIAEVAPSPVQIAEEAINNVPEVPVLVPVQVQPLPTPDAVQVPEASPVLPPQPDIIAVQPVDDVPAVQPIPVAPPAVQPITIDQPAVQPIPDLPAVQPIPIDQPAVQPIPAQPAVPENLPVAAAQGPHELFNDGVVQIQSNVDTGVFSTLQSWFNLVVNYFSDDVQLSSHNIV